MGFLKVTVLGMWIFPDTSGIRNIIHILALHYLLSLNTGQILLSQWLIITF